MFITSESYRIYDLQQPFQVFEWQKQNLNFSHFQHCIMPRLES